MSAPAVTPVRLIDAMRSVVDRLADRGIRAGFDIRDINPPCAVLLLPVFRWTFRGGAIECDHSLIAVGPNTQRGQSLSDLSDLLNEIQAALGSAITAADPTDVTTADGTGTLPAYRLSWTERICP